MSVITAGTSVGNGLVLESNQDGNLLVKTGPSATTAATFDSGGSVVIGVLSGTTVNYTNATFTTISATNFSVTSITISNVLKISQGGTGLSTTPTNGQLLVGNGTGYTLATLAAGSGITITNAAGSITITNSSTGGAQDYIVKSYGVT